MRDINSVYRVIHLTPIYRSQDKYGGPILGTKTKTHTCTACIECILRYHIASGNTKTRRYAERNVQKLSLRVAHYRISQSAWVAQSGEFESRAIVNSGLA